MTPNKLARLAFWARNMATIREGRMEWPGFSYDEREWSRMSVLAVAVPASAFRTFLVVNAVFFIAIAAVGIAGIFLPLATLLFPVPAETSTLKFSLLLAGCCFLIVGMGLPLSLGAAAWLCKGDAMQARLVEVPGDEELAAKVFWQINRITLVLCGLLVPGIVLFVAYDLHAGPLITALKWLAIALMALSAAAGAKQRTKR